MDRNTVRCICSALGSRSLSARRAWIEIGSCTSIACAASVALRKESVDRNWIMHQHCLRCIQVALRKESVDRNKTSTSRIRSAIGSLSARRAWIEIAGKKWMRTVGGSLSARRAWIEMFRTTFPNSCDGRSLSARRAWIEILSYISVCFVSAVALRKESVDRNDG